MTGMSLAEAKNAYPVIWTIYDHPKDFPEQIVARAWYGTYPDPTPLKFVDVATARYWFRSHGFVPLARAEGDDPCIVESWI